MTKDIKKDVSHVADLAKLELNEARLEKYAEQAGKIIEYFQKLNELDTKDITPTAHAVDVVSPLRKDEVVKFKEVDEIFDQAPERDGPFIQVPKVI